MAGNKCIFAPCNGKDTELKTSRSKGVATLLRRSEELGDTATHETLSNIIATHGAPSASVLCHKSCYSTYTSTSRNVTKRKSDSTHSEPGKRIVRSNVSAFDYKKDCLFCGLVCEPKDPKNPGRWNPVKQCQTVERPGCPPFKDVILSKCDERQDEWGEVVELRVNGVLDLPAADAQYHATCYNKFRKVPLDSSASASCKPVDSSLVAVIDQMNADQSMTWTVSELHDVYVANSGDLCRKQMLSSLCDYFGETIVVVRVEGCSTIVGFRHSVSKSLKLVQRARILGEDDDDVTQLVRRVRAEVRNIPLPREYDLSSFRHEKVIEDTSPTLLKLISSLVSKEGKVSKASMTLAQCIQQHVSSSWNQTTLGLAVKLHHQHGSSELVQTLHDHGIVITYDEVLRFRKSVAKYASDDPETYLRTTIFERVIGPIHGWGDNFDLCVFTPNGRRSTHAMATQFVQNPTGMPVTKGATHDGGIMSLKVPRLKKLECAKLHLVQNSSFAIKHYVGPKQMTPPNLPAVPRTDVIQDAIKQSVSRAQEKDAAWLSQLHSSTLPLDWSAYNAVQDRNGGDSVPKPKTKRAFGPLLDYPPAHPDTVLSTITYLDTSLRRLGMSYSHMTFDMQLYQIACLIKWSDHQQWSSVVLSPGMMHTVMSFIGSIGVLMKSTGLEELVGASFGGLTSIFNGKAWPKAMRAFRMTVSAMLHDFLEEGEKTHEQIAAFLEKAREHPTGRLWVDCFIIPTLLVHKFWRAEREGDWLLQQHCLEEMLPYFFAAGHHHYARWITWHLRDMQHIPVTAKDDLLAGSHVCRHSDGAAAVSADMFGEQTCIKQGKGAGGMKGISTNPEQVAVWIQSFGICSLLSKSMDEMYDDAEGLHETQKHKTHKEEGKRRRELDADDRANILRVLTENSNPLTTEMTTLNHIINGQIADEKVNVQDALEIGRDMSTKFSSSLPKGFHAPISKKVVTMKFMPKGVKVNGKTVRDLQAIFARLLVVGSKRHMELSTLFNYELGPVPASIIDEYGCLRKGNKSVLVQRLGVLDPNPPAPDVILVDASQLIYHVVWPSSGTVADLAASMGRRLHQHITETYVIFDQYNQISAKDHERQRRAAETSTKYHLSLTTPLPSRDKVMKNKANKKMLGGLLCTHSIGDHIEMVSRADSIVTHDEADVSLISYMLDAARRGAATIRILCDDTDVFVLLVFWCWKAGITCRLQMEKWNGTVLDINSTVQKLGDQCRSILAVHALSGCDTTSYPAGKGKVSALKAMSVVPGDLLHFIGEKGATDLQIQEAVRAFFLALYNQKKSASLDVARYDIYRKRKTPPALKTLPPTERNAHLHGQRAHLQVLLWKAANCPHPPAVEITNFGWNNLNRDAKEGEEVVMPVLDTSPVAPPALMDVISCGCKAETPCTTVKCSCAGEGLTCTSYCVCGGCEGTCCNPLTLQAQQEIDEDIDAEFGEGEGDTTDEDEDAADDVDDVI